MNLTYSIARVETPSSMRQAPCSMRHRQFAKRCQFNSLVYEVNPILYTIELPISMQMKRQRTFIKNEKRKKTIIVEDR
jgi:hypothetical protein